MSVRTVVSAFGCAWWLSGSRSAAPMYRKNPAKVASTSDRPLSGTRMNNLAAATSSAIAQYEVYGIDAVREIVRKDCSGYDCANHRRGLEGKADCEAVEEAVPGKGTGPHESARVYSVRVHTILFVIVVRMKDDVPVQHGIQEESQCREGEYRTRRVELCAELN